MKSSKLAAVMAGLTLWALCLASTASAQRITNGRDSDIIDAGTNITVRTNERIETNENDGRVYTGYVAQDVRDRRGDLVIPKGSEAELIVRRLSDNELGLDLESVTINGQRYALETQENVVGSERSGGLGKNKRTGEYVGGGAILGAIIGAIAGGGKGAAIGAGAGAAAGAGAQVLTRGRNVEVPAESLLTFRLARPLRAGVYDSGYMRNGYHYHGGYGADRYETQQAYRQKPGAYSNGQGTISIRNDNNVVWQSAGNGYVYVQVDNNPPQLFGSGQSGVEPAPWITQGHRYTFTLQDAYGNVIARDQLDLSR